MSDQWQHQVRLYFPDALVDVARRDPGSSALGPLPEILKAHGATLRCQYDAFANYVAEAEARGIEGYPLYEWTKVTIEDPVKKAKHLKSFAVLVKGREVYTKEEADALEADLQPLVNAGTVDGLSRHDTNPANNPQPPDHLRRPPA